MEFAKNIFFFIGSVMGILAFFKPLLEPLLEKNRQRWEKLQQVVTEDDFTNLGYQTWDSRYIKDKNLDRIQRLMHDIENKPEYLRFGPFLKKYYESELNELLRLYMCFRQLVQVPEWEPVGHLKGAEQEPGWCFNKKAFDKGNGYGEDYADDLYIASWYAQRMRNSYRRLSVLADIHLVEIPMAWWIVPKRMAAIELNT
jgi:hypothetical protein